MIDGKRIKNLNFNPVNKGNNFFVYWMQHSQRTFFNHALEYSIELSNKYLKPLVVYFCLTDSFPDANSRHYRFMLEGLKEVKAELFKRNIKFVCEIGSPETCVREISKQACCVVTDRGYLKIHKKWRKSIADNIDCAMFQVETDLVVPVEETSLKEEYGAYTIRRKINSRLDEFMVPVSEEKLMINSLGLNLSSADIDDTDKILKELSLNDNCKPSCIRGGSSHALKLLDLFIEQKLPYYSEKRNNPELDFTSGLSPYFHFGQISPVYAGLMVKTKKGEGRDSFLEEMIVRRELSFNFVTYNPFYDSFDCLPQWAKNTLLEHENDKRPYIYTSEEFENSLTHDRFWNAAQLELVLTGKMHGYMRMYWGKKIIEWTDSPKKAFNLAVYLNNKYALDGRDPNSFAGVAWCFGKHDRPWKERPVFGKIRYMNSNGLKRKFNPDLYADNIYAIKNSNHDLD
ncbi:MAG: deoxyribodipyrimidine photo-lyase [Desulfobacteraceae bacterium]|nr:deoxyribodipyrimidine photo-lyase [Desulfobacteraceae bacterium]MCB9495057.1 deoxyribodipyrimidine photo-lyase [Desulfobacteraceae bacterium]